MNHCNYQMPTSMIDMDKKILCGAYHKSKRKDNRIWAHFPHCKNEDCPIMHPELLKGAVLKEVQHV